MRDQQSWTWHSVDPEQSWRPAPATCLPAVTGSEGLTSAEQSSLVSGPKYAVTVKIRSHIPSLYPNTCTEFPGGCAASTSRLGGAQPACSTWEYAAWKPKESIPVCSPKLVFSGSVVLLGTETLCRSRVQLSPVRGRTCYRDAVHRSWASKWASQSIIHGPSTQQLPP